MNTLAKPLRAVVVEDEPLGRALLRQMLAREPDVNLVAECAGGNEAIPILERTHPDLVFLDVRIPDRDGFDVLSAASLSSSTAIVFVTAHDEYAVRAFDYNAVDYLLKPFDRDRFQRALDRARSHVRQTQGRSRYRERVVVKSRGSIFFLKTGEVDWIEAEGNYVRLHIGNESHLIRATIGGMESQLDPQRFVRIHRSQIVNIDRIRELRPWWHGEYHVLLKDGTQLTLSRSYRDALHSSLNGSRLSQS
jgi:two-component system LytT family response regulator